MKKVLSVFFLIILALMAVSSLNAQVMFNPFVPGECGPQIVDFYNNSDVSISDTAIWEWDVNGEIYEGENLLGLELQAGYYDVYLTLYDGPVYVGQDYTYFEIYPDATTFEISSGDQACPGEEIQFNFDDEISFYNVQWTFDDNTVPEDQHRDNWPTHTFYEPGIYNVTLAIEHYCGPDTVTRQVTVSSAALPKVKGYLTNGPDYCPSDPVSFDVEGEYTSYQWDFGDGTFSEKRRPTHVYPTDVAASYTAIVSATNICGNTDTSQVHVSFTEDIEADAGFDYWFDAQSAWPCPGTPVEFDAWGAGIYEWDFGDGSISNEQKPTNYYTEPGIYDISLTVWNGCGNMDYSQQSIEVQLNPSDIPYADFYFQLSGEYNDQIWLDTLRVCPGMPIQFIDASYSFSPSDLSYTWDFGDGSQAYTKNTSHVFNTASPLPYTVTLTVSSSCGGSNSLERYVMVDDNLKPDVNLMVTPQIICPGETAYFYIDGEDFDREDFTFDIDFGDGQVLNNARGYGDSLLQTIANHPYTGTDGQSFDFVFNVSNTCGNSLQKTGSITIDSDPSRFPFYYVSNSTSPEGSEQFMDWSSPRDTNDHEFVITAQWSAWPGTQDKFAVYFWYDGFDPEYPGPADAKVEFQGPNILTGETVHAYVPIDPERPPVVGFAVVWNCDGLYPNNVEPDVSGIQLDFLGVPQYSFPVIPGGFTDMLGLGDPIMLDPSWDGICKDQRLGNNYWYQLNPGQYIQLSFYEDYQEYYIDASKDREGYDWIAQIDYGDFYYLGDSLIIMTSWTACSDINGEYIFRINGDQLDLIPNYDDCSTRVQYLTGNTFREHSDMTPEGILAGCPGDEIEFIVAGGANYEWHFGDGSPVSNEPYPRHSYAAKGEYDAFVIATNNCGRRDTLYTPVMITEGNLPYANFWWDGYDFPRMQPINFYYDDYGYDQAGNYSYFWEFGDGNISTLQNPVHAYERNGDYTIKLTVSNGCGSNSSVQMIYITDAVLNCEAKIRIDSVVDRTVHLSDISRGEISSWFWDFGDGFTSSEKNPVHTYDQDGVFFVCLSVLDEINNCSQQVCRMVEIGTQRCHANFTAKVNEATGKVQFTDLSTNASEWFWEFGDGNFSDLQNPAHTYDEPGWYDVCLSVYDDLTDCFAFRCMEVQVGQEDPDFCFADFEYFINADDLSVIFSDRSSENITGWYWTFGDGSYKEERNPTKKFEAPGIYPVCLIVFDEETGCTDEICMEIPVGVTECNLRSDFEFFIGINTSTVSFSNRSGGKPTDYFWDFGDGSSSSAANPRHTYENPGFYLVSLSIWDEVNDCGDHTAEFLQIGSVECRAAFEYRVDALTNTVQFYNQSKAQTGSVAEYFWDFDDGTYSDEKDPQHHYTRAGMYFVSLTVINSDGLCMDFVYEPIQVGTVTCAANFKYYIDSTSNIAYFSPEKIGSATDYLWFFGDGAISTEKNPRHAFSSQGYFTVGLNTYNETTECMDYWEEVIVIGSAGQDCRANFSYISEPDTKTVRFGNRSQGKIIEYLWDFGDGNRSTQKNPENQYARGGYHMVCLTVVNSFGIPNTFCDFVQLATADDERCFADFIYAVDSASRTVEFVQTSHGDPDIFLWNFGDGNISEDENPAHKYGESDFYLVELYIENSTTSCSHTGYALVNVAEGNMGLQSAFSYKIDSSNLKAETYPVDFIGVSLGDAGKLKWIFGDGTVDTTTMNPTHVYANPGKYTACLIISDPVTGDSDTTCQEVTTPGYVGINTKSSWRNMIGNYPNPFEENTTIVYELSTATSVDLVLYDQTGRMVDRLVNKNQTAGRYRIEYSGSGLDPGIYTLRLATDQGVYASRMIVR